MQARPSSGEVNCRNSFKGKPFFSGVALFWHLAALALLLVGCSGPISGVLAGPSPVTIEQPGLIREESACAGTWIHAYPGPYPDMDPFTKWAYSDLGSDPYELTWSVGPSLGAGWASAFGYHGPKPVPGPSGYLRGSTGLHVLRATYQRQCAQITVCIPNERGKGCD